LYSPLLFTLGKEKKTQYEIAMHKKGRFIFLMPEFRGERKAQIIKLSVFLLEYLDLKLAQETTS